MYLTPDAPASNRRIRRVLTCPADADIVALVTGALSTLGYKSSWEKGGTLSEDEAARLFSRIVLDFVESNYMIGAFVSFAGTPPQGVIECVGQTLLRTDYPELWDVMPVGMKTATTIILPDLRGKFIFGAGMVGDDTYEVGDEGGTNRVLLDVSDMPIHTHATQPHTHSDLPHAHGYTGAAIVPNILGVEPSIAGVVPVPLVTSPSSVTILPTTVEVDSAGGGGRHENMPPFFVLKWGIVA